MVDPEGEWTSDRVWEEWSTDQSPVIQRLNAEIERLRDVIKNNADLLDPDYFVDGAKLIDLRMIVANLRRALEEK